MFSKDKRNIYRYNNGTKMIFADPLRLAHLMQVSYPKESNVDHDLKLLKLEDKPEALEALMRLAQYARTVFGLKEYDEDEAGVASGVTDIEAVGVFTDFLQWTQEQKKNIETTQTSPQSTESVLSTLEMSSQTTNAYADSTLTKNEVSCEIVGQLSAV